MNMDKLKAVLFFSFSVIAIAITGINIFGNLQDDSSKKKEFKAKYEVGQDVLVYTKEISKNDPVDENTEYSDIINYFIATVEKTPSNPTEQYSVKVKTNYHSKDINVGDRLQYPRNEVYNVKEELKYIESIKNDIKYISFKLNMRDVKKEFSLLKTMQLMLSEKDYDISYAINKYEKGDYVASDVIKILATKRLLLKTVNALENIYKLDLKFYENFNASVVDLERILDIELEMRKYEFLRNKNSNLRILHYMRSMGATELELAELVRTALQTGANIEIEDYLKLNKDSGEILGIYNDNHYRLASLYYQFANQKERITKSEEVMKQINANLKKIDGVLKNISNFTTYLIYYHKEVTQVKSITQIVNEAAEKARQENKNVEREYVYFDEFTGEVKRDRNQIVDQIVPNYGVNLNAAELTKYKQEQEDMLLKVTTEKAKFEKMKVKNNDELVKAYAEYQRVLGMMIEMGLDEDGSKLVEIAKCLIKRNLKADALDHLRKVAIKKFYIDTSKFDQENWFLELKRRSPSELEFFEHIINIKSEETDVASVNVGSEREGLK